MTTNKKQIKIILVVLFLLVSISLIIFQSNVWIKLKAVIYYPNSEYPELYQEAMLYKINGKIATPKSTTIITKYGIRITTPWGNVYESMVKDNMSTFENENIKFVMVKNSGNSIVKGFLDDMPPQIKDEINNVLSHSVLVDDFEFFKFIHTNSLRKIHLFMNSKEAKLRFSLALQKRFSLQANYIFETPFIKGFQIGEPRGKDRIILKVFTDNQSFDFIFQGYIPSQEELDYFISSIKVL